MSPDGLGLPDRAVAALRWTAAVLVVGTVHIGLGWWLSSHGFAQISTPDAPQGITVDLEPVAVSQKATTPSTTTASGADPTPQSAATPDPLPAAPPEQASVVPEPAPPPSEPPSAPPPPGPSPQPPQDAPRPEPVPAPTPAIEPPPPFPALTLPEQNRTSDAVLASLPAPLKPASTPPRPDPRQAAREAANRRTIAEQEEKRRVRQAEARAMARAEAKARTAVQPAASPRVGGGASIQTEAASSASSGQSIATWRGEVMARLNAVKPALPNGAGGVVRVAFSVDRGGRVMSVSIGASAGDPALDDAAMSMVRRASPLPPPPPEMGTRVSLSVPVRFR